MDIFLLIIGFLLIIIGLVGSLLPVLPGPLASWVGLLLLYLTKTISTDWTFLGVTFYTQPCEVVNMMSPSPYHPKYVQSTWYGSQLNG